MQSYFVVIKKNGLNQEKYPLKEWLRKHPSELPRGIDAMRETTHQLRAALLKNGWKMESQETEVWLIKPNPSVSSESEETFIHTNQNFEEQEHLTFHLEKDLQQSLRKNIKQLNPNLKIDDNNYELKTEAGRIDITAIDDSGRKVVIELKAGMAYPESVSQLLAYMGALQKDTNQNPLGIIVANDFHPNTVLAAGVTEKITLYKYSFQFTFNKI